jgi:3-oxoacyl-[acyl-carrier protein] reductase
MSGKTNQSDRVAVVTGGAGAIGGAIAARLAPEHTVAVLDRTGDFAVDLGDPDDVRRAANLVLDRHGRCDVFVHAAATFTPGPHGARFRRSTWSRRCCSRRRSPRECATGASAA